MTLSLIPFRFIPISLLVGPIHFAELGKLRVAHCRMGLQKGYDTGDLEYYGGEWHSVSQRYKKSPISDGGKGWYL